MHTVHVLVTPADSSEQATSKALTWLDEYPDPWWDWYEIGGRWDPFFTPGAFPGIAAGAEGNVIAVNNELSREVFSMISERQQRVWDDLRSKVTGVDLDGADHEKFLAETGEILAIENFSELQPLDSRIVTSAGMWFYYTNRLSDLLRGNWSADSAGILTHSNAYAPTNVRVMQEAVAQRSEGHYFIAVDFHF